MRILNKSREIAFVDDVKAHLVPEEGGRRRKRRGGGAKKPAAPHVSAAAKARSTSRANRLDIDDTGKTATFTGNVKAQQGDAALETAALEVQYEGGDADADRQRVRCCGAGRRHQDQAHRLANRPS